MARLLISAAHKSSGKTTVSLGLCAALKERGVTVQPFKKGPDYIDPMWLGLASGRDCRNLDSWLMGREEIASLFARASAGADLNLVEGNKGLYDGLDLDGSNSNAALAQLLDLPVVLVLDAHGMTRGIAPLILGYQAFDRNIRIAGVILNNLGGSRHESKLRAVIEHYTDVAVVGAVHFDERLQIVERHLGLMPSNEAGEAAARVRAIGARIAAQVDLDRVLAIARSAGSSTRNVAALAPAAKASRNKVRIAIARDRAFGFYYADDLEALQAAGAELVPIDLLGDPHLPPDADGLFIGGGFPEMFMEEIEANAGMRESVRAAVESGFPVYAECGGLMYLARTLTWRGRTCAMAGAFPGDVVMHAKPVGRGYVRLQETGRSPWAPGGKPAEAVIKAHEFHYSSLENLGQDMTFAYRVLRGHGIDGVHDGLVYKNTLASYSHLRSLQAYNWAERFVSLVRATLRRERYAEACA